MIGIDFSNMMGAGGITADEWEAAETAFGNAFDGYARLAASGTVGFVAVAADDALRQQSTGFAERARGRYDDVIILGIGGSALGPIALRTALRPSGWNMLGRDERNGHPRLHVLDNVDPETIVALLGRLDLAKSLFIVTSKSGGTAETMSQFLIVHDRVVSAGLPVAEHFVFVTDPAQGAVRPLAARESIPALDIPPNVGGRFSVRSQCRSHPRVPVAIAID